MTSTSSFKLIILTVFISITALLLLITPSVAQSPAPTTSLIAVNKIVPNKVGTIKKPKSVNFQVQGKISTTGEDGLNKPIVQKIEIKFPKGVYYAGGKLPKGVKGKVLPKCSEAKMKKGLPRNVCPKNSIIGSGSGNAWADTVKTRIKYTLVNGGKDKVFVYTQMTNPAVVQTPMVGKINKTKGKFAYRLTISVPERLQIVAGTPISLIDFKLKTNKKNWMFSTSCPKNKKWNFETTSFQNTTTPAKFKSSSLCSK